MASPSTFAIRLPNDRATRSLNWHDVVGDALVLIALPLLFFPSALLPLGFFVVLFWYAWRWLWRASPVPKTRVNVLLLVLLVMVAIGLRIAPEPAYSTVTVAHILVGVTLFFAIQDWGAWPNALWRIVELAVLLGLGFTLASPFVTSGAWNKLFNIAIVDMRFHALLDQPSNPNIVAGMLAPMLPLALALVESGRRGGRVLGAVALLPLLVMLILLQSRGALFAAAIGLVVYATLHWKWVLPLLPLTLLAGLVFNNANGSPIPIQAFVERNTTDRTLQVELREPIWRQSITQLIHSPIVGIGVNEVYVNVQPASPTPQIVHLHAHNLWLQIALDTGIIGLAAFAGIFGYAVYCAWRAYCARIERIIAIAVLASLAAMVTHGMLDTIYWGMKPEALLWVVLGVAVALDTLKRSNTVSS